MFEPMPDYEKTISKMFSFKNHVINNLMWFF